jgi:hypothetical protein
MAFMHRSHSAGFGVRMAGRLRKFEEVRVFRRFAPAMVLFAALAPPMAHAQVDIDQDKTPAHIYASDCAACHKSMRGLANGRGNAALTGFLAEHYTSSRQEAATMATYILAGGGGVGTVAPVGEDKPHPAGEPKTREARRPPPKPEPAPSTDLRRPAGQGTKPERDERAAAVEPGHISGGDERQPPGERRQPSVAAPTHGRTKPPGAAPRKPETATAAAAPKSADSPMPKVSPAAAAPNAAAPPPSDVSPTDNIPD